MAKLIAHLIPQSIAYLQVLNKLPIPKRLFKLRSTAFIETHPMKIHRIRSSQFDSIIEFQEARELSPHSEKKDDSEIKHFQKDILKLNFPEIKNHPDIQKFKKRIVAFAKQYGDKTEKTTSIFMNYLETVREAGVNCLKNKQILKACSYFAQCLTFIDPKHDEVFYQKFLIVKIDAINKLMYCIFQLEASQKNQFKDPTTKRFHNAEKILIQFLHELRQFQKYQSLKKSENCLLEMNYFFLGRLHRKNNNNLKAIQAFLTAEDLIVAKLEIKDSKDLRSSSTTKNEPMKRFLQNIKIKIHYKLSKCYREEKQPQKQRQYEDQALEEAHQINLKLYAYIHRKIQFFDRKKKFTEKLSRLDGRKKIEEEILKLIDESKQNQINSLYNVYNNQREARR